MATTESSANPHEFGTKDTRKDEMRESTEEFIEDLIAEAKSASESETFKRFLDAQSAFHDYSYRNTLLIQMQCPHATHVAGYRTWQTEFDRHVQEGESAIWIWRPIITNKCPECGNSPSYHDSIECEYDETDPEEWSEGVVAFRTASVFDVSQTEGKPLPELPSDAEGDADELLDDMIEAADGLSADVEIVPTDEWDHGTANGVCDTSAREIEIKDRENAAVAGSLAHEYAHALLHGDDDTTEQDRELEAEAVAYVVGRHFGLDMGGSGFYLAAWENDDAEAIRGRLDRINKTAQKIIDAAEPLWESLRAKQM